MGIVQFRSAHRISPAVQKKKQEDQKFDAILLAVHSPGLLWEGDGRVGFEQASAFGTYGL
jgi:hypothetical protein